jgi:TPR repeat protein
MKNDQVNHPLHYNWHPSGVECATIAEAFGYNLGNAIKYIWRCDHKGQPIEDLQKAVTYLNREIDRRIDEANTSPLVTKSVSLPDSILQTDTVHTIPVEAPRFLDYADAKEQVEIGKDYYHGTNNRNKDFEIAIEWWKMAAAQDNAEAQWLLGNAYLFGRGVKKNKEEAHRLWKLSQQNRFGKDAQ